MKKYWERQEGVREPVWHRKQKIWETRRYSKYSSVQGPGEIHFVLLTFMDQVVVMSSSLYLDYNFIFVIKC